jgi:prepilin-type N-terminal cleavage/methylation domain-containing protein
MLQYSINLNKSKIMAKIKSFFPPKADQPRAEKKLIKQLKNNKGFSLTELMVVMSIVGTVATLSSASMDDILPMARDAQRKANVKQVQTALNLYYNDHEQYPVSVTTEPTAEDWQSMKDILEAIDETYVPEMPHDPLDTDPYVFKYWSDGQKFKITYETEDPLDESPQVAWGL